MPATFTCLILATAALLLGMAALTLWTSLRRGRRLGQVRVGGLHGVVLPALLVAVGSCSKGDEPQSVDTGQDPEVEVCLFFAPNVPIILCQKAVK